MLNGDARDLGLSPRPLRKRGSRSAYRQTSNTPSGASAARRGASPSPPERGQGRGLSLITDNQCQGIFAANIGVNAVLALGPVNLLLATDNVITIFNPKDARQASARLGLSLSFGRGDNDE